MAVEPRHNGYTAVAGLGVTGVACVRHLRARGEAVVALDSRAEPPGAATVAAEHPEVELITGGFDAERLAGAERVVVSPGLDLRRGPLSDLRAAGRPVVGELSLFAEAAQGPVCAVTGSNGKSTVVTLLGEMAAAAGLDVGVGGNLGTPALALLEAAPADGYLLEVSSFQLETCLGFRADYGAVLNVSPDHMDRYDSLGDYAATKDRILDGVTVAVVGHDDPWTAAMGHAAPRRLSFGVDAEADYRIADVQGERWLLAADTPRLPVRALPVPGSAHQLNALASMALADALGIPGDAQAAVLRGFAGLPHRLERIGTWDGVTWINDSKATNVGAAVAALSGMPGAVVLIAGGQGKGADFTALAEACRERARAVVLIGEDAPAIEAALAGRVPSVCARDMTEAVEQARRRAQPGDTVLLAPACASFDQYAGFEARGVAFREAVEREVAHG